MNKDKNKNKKEEPLKIRTKKPQKAIFNIKNKSLENKETDLPVKIQKQKIEKEKMTPKERIKYSLKLFFASLIVIMIAGMSVGFLVLCSWTQDMPDLDVSLLQESAQSSYIYDVDGNTVAIFSSSESRSWVKLEDIPQDIIDAFIATEDIRFYEHDGVDIKRFGSAVLGQFLGSSHGGSTITQQLIKNVYLTNEVTYKRKIQEILLAFQLESKMTKDEIMESYLNIIYFGESNYGVKAAAEDYFGKTLDELNLKECAMLAGLVKNPNGYDPRRNMYVREDMSPTEERTDTVLYSMCNNGYITQEEYDEASATEFNIKENSTATSIYSYPHFVEYVISDVVDDMIKKEGLDDNGTNRAIIEWRIRSGGYKIYTTLDSSAQETLQSDIANYDNYPVAIDSDGNETDEQAQAAAVIMDHKTGHIVAMVGSREEPTAYKTFNRATNNTMPVGSSIKPLSAYAPTIELGASSGTIGYNYAFKIDGYDSHTDYPAGSMGTQKPMTYREALQTSSNVIPAKIIAQDLGYDLAKQYLLEMGISESSVQKNGSGLALGTSGINMLEMTAAYATIANGGTYLEPKSYTTVVDRTDNIVLDSTNYQIKRQVFSESTCWILSDILKTVIDYNKYVTGAEGIATAGKSGTHEDKCATFAGYTGYYTSVVWVGSDKYSSFKSISGARTAGVLFSKYMTDIHNQENLTNIEISPNSMEDSGVVACEICNISGLKANDACREQGCAVTEYFKEGTEPSDECDMHVVKALCKSTGSLATDSCPSWSRYDEAILFIPSNNYLSKITRELVKATFPNAIFEDELGYCTRHNGGDEYISDADIANIQLLISNLDNLKLTDKPTAEEMASINLFIDELNNILNTINTVTFDELAAMTETIRSRYNDINAFYNNINTRTQALPEDTNNEDEMPVDSESSESSESTVPEDTPSVEDPESSESSESTSEPSEDIPEDIPQPDVEPISNEE